MNTDYLTVASEIAREAGALLREYLEKGVAVEYKAKFDVVTAADRASEKLVVDRLRNRFPRHTILGEEGFGVDNGSEYIWHIDPLDGTTNFSHGYPIFAVSIGLEKNGESVVGVVYDPTREEFFAAEAGSGAYLNNRRMRVSKVEKLEDGLFATGFPPANRTSNRNVHNFYQFSVLTHGTRRAGSAALDICSVAAGRLEGFWELGLKSWDVSGGVTILKEAGGKVSDMQGGKFLSGGPHLTVSNGLVHEQMLEIFQLVAEGRPPAPVPPAVG
ncbi:MAG: inositol monophosphatase [Acidobacteria bacterium]|nr:inositol monophosphatase [Acidobacteriota bacterium]